jgi:hypothetical protein
MVGASLHDPAGTSGSTDSLDADLDVTRPLPTERGESKDATSSIEVESC